MGVVADAAPPPPLPFSPSQYLVLQHVLLPQLKQGRSRAERRTDKAWQQAATWRKELGMTSAPNRPNKENSWRLDAMYDDE
jgi:hypothetical protein